MLVELYIIYLKAQQQGAHIVTVPDSVLTRMHRINQPTKQASLETVQAFKKDGLVGNIHF